MTHSNATAHGRQAGYHGNPQASDAARSTSGGKGAIAGGVQKVLLAINSRKTNLSDTQAIH